ncbi:hypothetical protein [Herbaspirillum huttiense]|nr:hypothetical protein [Herbaspirillum huttiense]
MDIIRKKFSHIAMDPTLIADLSTMRKIQHATLSERVYQDL